MALEYIARYMAVSANGGSDSPRELSSGPFLVTDEQGVAFADRTAIAHAQCYPAQHRHDHPDELCSLLTVYRMQEDWVPVCVYPKGNTGTIEYDAALLGWKKGEAMAVAMITRPCGVLPDDLSKGEAIARAREAGEQTASRESAASEEGITYSLSALSRVGIDGGRKKTILFWVSEAA